MMRCVMTATCAALLCAASAAPAVLAQAPSRPADRPSTERLTVGILVTLSGPGAVLGQHARDGFALAVQQRGGKLGGRDVDLLVVDDELKPDVAVARARRLVEQDRADFVVGPIFSNVLAAIAAARHAGVAPADAIAAVERFGGIKRRMELRGAAAGVEVYDDFAHHPTAIATTVAGLRARIGPAARILAVLEPRSNTMKLGAMKAQLPGSLAEADRTYCYGGGLGWDAAEALAPLSERAQAHDDLGALVDAVAREARPGDRVLVMSNGGFGGVHERLLAALAARGA